MLSICLLSCSKKAGETPAQVETGTIELKSLDPGNAGSESSPAAPAPQSIEQESGKTADNKSIQEKDLPAAEDNRDKAPQTESIVPEQIRRPREGEAPRYPADAVIGDLGAGEASAGAYAYARRLLEGLMQKESRKGLLDFVDTDEAERVSGILDEVKPLKVRVGGGKEEPDGSTSFLLRYIGESLWAAGELYIRQQDGAWNAEELILDRPESREKALERFRFDFPPYERFF